VTETSDFSFQKANNKIFFYCQAKKVFYFRHCHYLLIHMGIDLVAADGEVALIGASSVLGKVVSPTRVERSLLARWERGLALCAFDAVSFSFSKNRSPPSKCFICL
jgi:hypothetical protein